MQETPFQLKSEYHPTGDQPRAIDRLVEGLRSGERMRLWRYAKRRTMGFRRKAPCRR